MGYFRDADDCPAACCTPPPPRFSMCLSCTSEDMAVWALMMHCVAAGVFFHGALQQRPLSRQQDVLFPSSSLLLPLFSQWEGAGLYSMFFFRKEEGHPPPPPRPT